MFSQPSDKINEYLFALEKGDGWFQLVGANMSMRASSYTSTTLSCVCLFIKHLVQYVFLQVRR
jgi:hypothetical protein